MKTVVKYILLTIAFMFLSSGVLVAGFLDAYDTVGYAIFWLLLPMTILFLSAVLVNDRVLIPRLLLKSRFGGYCVSVFGVVYILTLLSLVLEYITRRFFDLPMRISDYSSPWIFADSLGNGLLLAMILLGLGLFHLFNLWKQEMETEKDLNSNLQSYISSVKNRLNPKLVLSMLYAILADKSATSECIEKKIRNLSTYLREQLYELPEPPKVASPKVEGIGNSRLVTILVSKRYRVGRHLIFLGILAVISCGAFFNTPDQPEFSFIRLFAVLSMFLVLSGIAYCDILWLYPRFMKRGNIKKYAFSVVILLIFLVLPLIVGQILTYEPNIYTKQLSAFLVIISTIGTMLSLFLFIGGISAILLLQNWIETKQRLILLQAETIRQEYSYLRKQINPHFLFNVLNNIGISVYDDPEYAKRLIGDLVALLKYQLENLGCETTTLSQELKFIRSYFALEATRRETFNYEIYTDFDNDIAGIQTLLFIPFVENAVKYSTPDAEIPEVKVTVSLRNGRIIFVCVNPYDKEMIGNLRNGGIGLENTIRRLQLLYEDAYKISFEKTDRIFSVILEIPVQ